jgi:hypothetical protein
MTNDNISVGYAERGGGWGGASSSKKLLVTMKSVPVPTPGTNPF